MRKSVEARVTIDVSVTCPEEMNVEQLLYDLTTECQIFISDQQIKNFPDADKVEDIEDQIEIHEQGTVSSVEVLSEEMVEGA